MMRYLSVCSGIEAASCAWHPIGWEPVAFSEIEAFPAAVLAHHYPDTPNWGDMTRYKEWPHADVDVLVGGTPCQSFSVAGLRKGLADPRGNLMLTFGSIAQKYKPRWIVWENVPGVLSSDGGRDFGTFLGMLGELGYGTAYRVLNAEYYGVAQRRRRVFVIGYLGDWRRAAAVLFERESLRGDTPPSREARKDVARAVAARTGGGGGLGTDFDCDGGLITEDVADTLAVGANQTTGFPSPSVVASTGEVSHCLNAGGMGRIDYETETMVAHTMRAEHDASEDGTGRGTPIVPVVFGLRGREGGAMPEGPHDTANIRAASDGSSRSYIAEQWAVRRLTPVECERLQGFPDGYTAIPWRGKPADQCPDGPRYKALGNSFAVNVVRWIGERIQMVEEVE